jgi:hypothetical protein
VSVDALVKAQIIIKLDFSAALTLDHLRWHKGIVSSIPGQRSQYQPVLELALANLQGFE